MITYADIKVSDYEIGLTKLVGKISNWTIDSLKETKSVNLSIPVNTNKIPRNILIADKIFFLFSNLKILFKKGFRDNSIFIIFFSIVTYPT